MKRVYSTIVCVLLAMTMGMACAQISDAMRKLNTAVFAVREMYVDTVNETKMVEDMINHMLHELDPHSSYTLSLRKRRSAFCSPESSDTEPWNS